MCVCECSLCIWKYCVQLEARQLKFVSDKVVARNELGVKKGQLTYLKNLAKVTSAIMPK